MIINGMNTEAGMRSGFTLLEVMVAMAIMAIGLTVLYSSQSRSLFVADISDFAATSSLLGSLQMAEILQSDDQSLSSAGDFGERYPGYGWRFQISEAERAAELIPVRAAGSLQRIELTITDKPRDKSFTMVRYRFWGGK